MLAVHLQFVPQYAPICNAVSCWLFKKERKGNTAIHLLFVPPYSSYLYRSMPPIRTGNTFEKKLGVGGSGKFLNRVSRATLLFVLASTSYRVWSFVHWGRSNAIDPVDWPKPGFRNGLERILLVFAGENKQTHSSGVGAPNLKFAYFRVFGDRPQ